MKLFLIKIGKAFSTLKRDGLLRGGRRIIVAGWAIFKALFQWKKGDILFVTGGVGDSAWYRTHNVAEELEIHGFKCATIVQDSPILPFLAKNFKIFIFHRTLFSSGVRKLIEKVKEQEGEIIFDTDDLVYDSKYLKHMDFYNRMNKMERKLYENGVGGEILSDPYVSMCTTTTSFLKEKLEGFNKKVILVPNKLSNDDLGFADTAEKIKRANEKDESSKIRIGYFSGTLSHNKDFATITNALMRLMEKNDNVELCLFGPLDPENKLNKFSNRIKRFNFVPREKHYQNISKVDINLLPLEIGNPFCESKSELKFFEAGIVGVPTVASSVGTNKEAIKDGIDGFLASNDEEWFDKLDILVNNEEIRRDMGRKAKEKTLTIYTNKHSNNEEYYNYLRGKL